MTDPANDIFGQAREGSVAAIIQILNERLSEEGIRTRAVFADGILQLLCEAPTAEQLDQTFVVERVRKILEMISPRRIRKVNINGRIVREQQLLWLEEINRDPERQLLWSEMIVLKQPNLVRRLSRALEAPKHRSRFPKGVSESDLRQRKSFMRGLAGGLSAALLLLLAVGWLLRDRVAGPIRVEQAAEEETGAIAQPEIAPAPSPAEPEPIETGEPAAPAPAATPEPYDPFARAVRLAEQAAVEGQSATTPEDWLQLAARWQQASDLMAEVPSTDERYAVAQDRVQAYQTNSTALLLRAEQAQQ
ncbi:MAG: hypothetical protein F6J97_04305 [Leptolyngbya sp. SIO4C1]|nr:hypothetical protein [Leptolyngbya sp. SIO4C1]